MSIELPGRIPGTQLLGASALIEHYGLECPIPRHLMAVGSVGRRTLVQQDGIEWTLLPISAAILEDLVGYRAALEDYSSPTLSAIAWEATDDGNVRVTNETAYLYRYFDATRQAEYVVDRIERTIRFSLPAELNYLHRFDDAKRRLADIIDMPDRLVSLFIQFCARNGGRLSVRKRDQYFAELSNDELSAMEAAVTASGIANLH